MNGRLDPMNFMFFIGIALCWLTLIVYVVLALFGIDLSEQVSKGFFVVLIGMIIIRTLVVIWDYVNTYRHRNDNPGPNPYL